MVDQSRPLAEDLILEEYRAARSYMRHIERLRQDGGRWYLLIVAGVLGFLLRDISAANLSSLRERASTSVLLIFLALYSLLLSFFLAAQKPGYDVHYRRVKELTPEAYKWSPRSNRPAVDGYILGAFANFHRQVSLLGVGFVVFLTAIWRAHWLLIMLAVLVFLGAAEFPVLRLYAARSHWKPEQSEVDGQVPPGETPGAPADGTESAV